ncbi:mycofactocin precursor MftA [Streptomyces sp. NPDC058175]
MNEFDTVPADEQVTEVATDTLVETDALIEEVSIDGMCGVY